MDVVRNAQWAAEKLREGLCISFEDEDDGMYYVKDKTTQEIWGVYAGYGEAILYADADKFASNWTDYARFKEVVVAPPAVCEAT